MKKEDTHEQNFQINTCKTSMIGESPMLDANRTLVNFEFQDNDPLTKRIHDCI